MKRIVLALILCTFSTRKLFADGTTNEPPILTLLDAEKLALTAR